MKTIQKHDQGHGLRGPQGPGSTRRGAALIVSLICVTVIAGLGAALIQMQSAVNRRHAFSIDRRRALYVAEAGIAESALAVSQGKSGIIASEAIPATFGGGLFWVETNDLPEDRIALVCTSRVGTAEFMLRTIVVPNLNPISSLGFFGADGVDIGWGTVADGYNSGQGEYLTQVDGMLPVVSTGERLSLGSNADIILEEGLLSGGLPSGGGSGSGGVLPGKDGGGSAPSGPTGGDSGDGRIAPGGTGGWAPLVSSTPASRSTASSGSPGAGDGGTTGGGAAPGGGSGSGSGGGSPTLAPPGAPTRLFGRLRPGPEGSVLSNGFSELIGSVTPARYPTELPQANFPTVGETIAGNYVVVGSENNIGTRSETRVTGNVIVGTGQTLKLVGPTVLVVNQMLVHAGGTLEFDSSMGPIDLYMTQGIHLLSGSALDSLTPHAQSRGTTLIVGEATGAPDRVIIEASGNFHGIFYAPSDAVELPSSLRVFGSVVARHLSTAEGAHISYDRRLSIGGDGVPTLPKILSWQIVPLGEGTARRLNIEPVMELRLRGITPVASSIGAPESNVEVQYISTSGSHAKYMGPIGGFNPVVADRIVGLRWDDPRDGSAREWLRPAGDDPTGSIEEGRATKRSIRRVIREVSTVDEVGYLTDAEAIDLVTSLPNDVLNTKSADVVEVNDRIGGGTRRDNNEDGLTFDLDAWWDKTRDKDGKSEDAAPATGTVPTTPGGI